MRSIRLGLGIVVLLLAFGAAAGGAAAKPKHLRIPPRLELQLRLPSSHGYSIYVVANRRQVAVLASNREGTSATYEARGRASSDGLAVDLGRFGRIDARFEPTGPVKRDTPRGCRGKPTETTRGVAVGTIRFRGRNGFVKLAARQAKAGLVRTFGLVCRFPADGSFLGRDASRARAAPDVGREPRSADVFSAFRRAGGERISLLASNLGIPELGGFLSATTQQRFGRVKVVDGAFGAVTTKELSISGSGVHPATAHIRGSGPFAGEGDYEATAGGSGWSGSLRVRLPGEGVIPLSGPGFRARVCHRPLTSGTALTCGLEKRSGPQPSGSQSQSLFATRLSWSR